MNRRDTLKILATLPLASMAGGLLAAPTSKTRLLLVFLRGGYDAANLLVPISSSFYYEARPTIAIPRPGTDLDSALMLNANWGLHPVLRETIYPLFTSGQVAFIPFAGTDDTSRSHFETQDSIELGQPLDGSRDYQALLAVLAEAALRGPLGIYEKDQRVQDLGRIQEILADSLKPTLQWLANRALLVG